MKSKAINYLKCIACLLVINTHITEMYPSRLGFMAWGGYFANSIFFFASGYCLTNVSKIFPKWYGKRFIRIYIPYLLALPLLFFAGRLTGWNWINILMPMNEYHFIPSILFLYIVYYFLTKLNQKTIFKYLFQILVLGMTVLLYFVFIFDKTKSPIEHFSFIETVTYLIPMLLGGLAKEGKLIKNKLMCVGLVIITFVIYIYQSFRPFTGYLKVLQPCIGLFFAYGLGCFFLLVEDKLKEVKLVNLIASVTLECYIVQFVSRSAFISIGFPTNIIYHVICSVAVAYCLHFISNCIINQLGKKTKKYVTN